MNMFLVINTNSAKSDHKVKVFYTKTKVTFKTLRARYWMGNSTVGADFFIIAGMKNAVFM